MLIVYYLHNFKIEVNSSANLAIATVLIDSLWFWGTQVLTAIIIDNISVISYYISYLYVIQLTASDPKWIKLCTLVKDIYQANIVDPTLVKSSLELNLLVGAGGNDSIYK